VSGEIALLDAVRLVWASLWSDAALLYRRELKLELDRVREQYMDVVHDGTKLDNRLELLLHVVMELVECDSAALELSKDTVKSTRHAYVQRLLEAVGPERCDEARSVIEIACLSWKLRDDDNVLLVWVFGPHFRLGASWASIAASCRENDAMSSAICSGCV
jgi:hypothetical protein